LGRIGVGPSFGYEVEIMIMLIVKLPMQIQNTENKKDHFTFFLLLLKNFFNQRMLFCDVVWAYLDA
jgi:hypothetical protein